MGQIIINYLLIFGLPLAVGLLVRILLNRFSKAYLVTVAFAALTLVLWVVANVVPSHGNEGNGILAVQATASFASSLVIGIILKLKSKIKSADKTKE